MGFFSKKDDNELFSLLENEEYKISDEWKTDSVKPAHALTPEEVCGFENWENVSASSSGALETLKKRLVDIRHEAKATDTLKDELKNVDEYDNSCELIKQKEPSQTMDKSDVKPHKTLLEKCKPFIVDDEGNETEPPSVAYKLKSVAEILQSESQKTLDRLSEKYDISFDDLGRYTELYKPEEINKSIETDFDAEPQIFEEKLPITGKSQKQVSETAVISDIDSEISHTRIIETDNSETVKFTPVKDDNHTSRISISSETNLIDLTNEFFKLEDEQEEANNETQLELSEFEEFDPKLEFKTDNDAKQLNRLLSLKKRNYFLSSVFSIFLTVILGFARLPFMSGVILSNTRTAMIICSAITGIIILLNGDMFVSFKKMFSRHCNSDISASLASISVIPYTVLGIIKNEIFLDILILLSVILSFRALCCFFKSSYMLSNFKQIATNTPKRAVRLISDGAVTFAMAKNSIEGDVLAAVSQNTDRIDDYMKYSEFGVSLDGKLPVITVISFLLSLICGFASASYNGSSLQGFYDAAVILCLTATPILFLIDNLPIYNAAGKLNRIGAMLAGKTGAEHIQKANAVVLTAQQIFPSGSVTLHKIQVLAANSIDDTIIRAASLTESMGSPLAPIFKKIAGTAVIEELPYSDTVKYEDFRGISGWVDNKLLLIGNRTLMETHGISVPNVEVDRKILRQGYFPVYVATDDKACALLIIEYSVVPEIARELRKISVLGVTMLINSCDPNLTEEMICDYMGLYEDSVKVMSSAGSHIYRNVVAKTAHCSAPAAYKGNPRALAAIINCANKIRRSNVLLTVLYVLSAIFGVVLFAYISFLGSGTLLSGGSVLLYVLACTIFTLILYFTEKP